MGYQTTLTVQHLLHLTQGIFPAETQFGKLIGRNSTGTLRAERAFTVQRIVYINYPALTVCSDRDATSQVNHNQIQFFIMLSDGSGIFTRYRLTVQGMEDGNALYLRYSRQTGYRLQLVYHFGIGNIGGTMTFPGNFIGNQRSQVTSVLHPGVQQIMFHLFVNDIHPAGRRLQQTATGNDGIKIQRNIRLGKQSQYKILTVLILFVDVVKLRQD